jgi:hypothetical protein
MQESSPAPSDYPPPQTVFLLSKLCAVDGTSYHGAQFSVSAMDAEALTMSFVTDILWKHVSLDTATDPSPSHNYAICRLLYDPERPNFEVLVDIGACPLLPCITRHITYTISTGARDAPWPTLSWRRNVDLSLSKLVDTAILQTIVACVLTVATAVFFFFIFHLTGEWLFGEPFSDTLWRLELRRLLILYLFIAIRIFFGLIALAVFRRRLTRFVQTLWAASFYDTAALPRRLLSFKQSPFVRLTPLSFLGTALGAGLCLCWAHFRGRLMLNLALLQVLELPLYWFWLVLVRRARWLDMDTLSAWYASETGQQVLIRAAAAMLLLIMPATEVVYFAAKPDYIVVGVNVLFALTYSVWLYLDLRRGLSMWLIRQREDRHKYVWYFIFYFLFYMAVYGMVVGERMGSPYLRCMGILYIGLLSGSIGFVTGANSLAPRPGHQYAES